jgi:uncharacterized protein
MSETLTRARPQIDHPEALQRVLGWVEERFQPVAIFLFGSRARREASKDSDYDLVVVLCDDFPAERLKYWEWGQELRGHGIDANLSFSRQSAFAWRRHEVGTLEYEVEVDGVQLYPRHRWLPPSVERPGSMNTTFVGVPAVARSPAMPGVAKVATVVEEWLAQVQEDLDAAVSCIHGPRPAPSRAAFHVQQAAEKLAKGALAAHHIRSEKTHEIGDIAERLPDGFALKPRLLDLERFSGYAMSFRYPRGPSLPVPAASEIDQWIAEIEALKADFEQWRGAREGGEGS